ncbi:MAG: DUF58 domain-containing protein [Nitrospinota bacterium]|nr:MAG: DUF58 domain-containing protein [Nitrospinota bacterium]
MAEQKRYFDPQLLSTIAPLSLQARLVVEGVLSGLHNSPYKGFSVEFSEHREYTPGDEIRHIDWKAYGRFDRYFIKEYEEETNLRCYLLVDCSASMGYGSNGVSKFDYASYLAAALAYLMQKQQDLVSLVLFGQEVRKQLPPKSNPGHLQAILNALEQTVPAGETSVGKVLHHLVSSIKRRSLVILLSDLLDDQETVMRGLRHLRHRKNEVLVFQIFDPTEIEFPFRDFTRFEDLEGPVKVITDPRAIAQEYRRNVMEFIQYYRQQCRLHYIDYQLFSTATPLDKALLQYLAWRK